MESEIKLDELALKRSQEMEQIRAAATSWSRG